MDKTELLNALKDPELAKEAQRALKSNKLDLNLDNLDDPDQLKGILSSLLSAINKLDDKFEASQQEVDKKIQGTSLEQKRAELEKSAQRLAKKSPVFKEAYERWQKQEEVPEMVALNGLLASNDYDVEETWKEVISAKGITDETFTEKPSKSADKKAPPKSPPSSSTEESVPADEEKQLQDTSETPEQLIAAQLREFRAQHATAETEPTL